MFDLGIQELIVIFVVALLVFGPKRLPELGRSLGKGLTELKKALQEAKTQIDSELDQPHKPEKIDLPQSLADVPEERPGEKDEKADQIVSDEREKKGKPAE